MLQNRIGPVRALIVGIGIGIGIGIASVAGSAAAQGGDAAKGHGWGYEGEHGAAHWSELQPEYAACATGRNQSPIDIKDAVPSDLEAIQVDYRTVPLRIIDNGHTIQVNYGAGSAITVGGRRYELVQFHFHHPSEEKINGQGYPLVAHLVHRSSDNQYAVIAVLLKQGRHNPFIQTLWNNLPPVKEKEFAPVDVGIDLAAFLPRDQGYYTFQGSLTTPPCSEGVTWLVLKTPVEIASAQIARFGDIYSNNSRPLQARNERVIKLSR